LYVKLQRSAGMEVLLVDDDRASCLMLSKMVASLGYKCDVVHSVADGLRAAARKKYTLIMMDCHLPDQTGWVATHAIRLLPRDGPPPSIIGILSFPDDVMQCQCATARMAGVIVKPYNKREISDSISKAISHQQAITDSRCTATNADHGSFALCSRKYRSSSQRKVSTLTDDEIRKSSTSQELETSTLRLDFALHPDIPNPILQDPDQLLKST
jgi:CheY-like chemotaxis protein